MKKFSLVKESTDKIKTYFAQIDLKMSVDAKSKDEAKKIISEELKGAFPNDDSKKTYIEDFSFTTTDAVSIKESVAINEANIEDKGRLNVQLVVMLNNQIKNELQSSQIYRAMSCWLDDKGWVDATKYYFKSATEELAHMNKVYEYMFLRNVLAVVPTTDDVKQNFDSIRQILDESLTHEIKVSDEWEAISNKAKEVGDNTTFAFAQWFLNEQTEEEEKFRNFLFKMNLDMPDWKLDELFKESI